MPEVLPELVLSVGQELFVSVWEGVMVRLLELVLPVRRKAFVFVREAIMVRLLVPVLPVLVAPALVLRRCFAREQACQLWLVFVLLLGPVSAALERQGLHWCLEQGRQVFLPGLQVAALCSQAVGR